MKKKIMIAFCMAFLFGITACSGEKEPEQKPIVNEQQEEQKETEVTSDEEMSDIEDQKADPVEVIIYKIDGETGETVTESKEVESLTEKGIWVLLKESGMVEEGTEVLSLKKNGDKLELDLNKAFGDQLRSYGTTGEQELLTCVVNTFLDAYKCSEIKITEEGETLLSGHAEYEDYFQKFE